MICFSSNQLCLLKVTNAGRKGNRKSFLLSEQMMHVVARSGQRENEQRIYKRVRQDFGIKIRLCPNRDTVSWL
jgi:hypothetical protein